MDLLLAQATPSVPAEWWVPLVGAILVALWDILKRKFNLVEPVQPTPEPTPAPAPVPAPTPTPVLDLVKQLLPVLVPLLVPAIKESLKSEQEPSK